MKIRLQITAISFLLKATFAISSANAGVVTATLGLSGSVTEADVFTSNPQSAFTTGHNSGPEDRRGFFEMIIPAFSGTVDSATVTLNTREVMNLTGALNSMQFYAIGSSAPSDFNNVISGTVARTPNAQVPLTSLQSFSFDLSAGGISEIQARGSGGSLFFGLALGGVEADTSNNVIHAFAFHSGAPLSSSATLQFQTSGASVPEPSSLAMLVIGTLALVSFRRPGKRRQNPTSL